jgi:hypothetical protein
VARPSAASTRGTGAAGFRWLDNTLWDDVEARGGEGATKKRRMGHSRITSASAPITGQRLRAVSVCVLEVVSGSVCVCVCVGEAPSSDGAREPTTSSTCSHSSRSAASPPPAPTEQGGE